MLDPTPPPLPPPPPNFKLQFRYNSLIRLYPGSRSLVSLFHSSFHFSFPVYIYIFPTSPTRSGPAFRLPTARTYFYISVDTGLAGTQPLAHVSSLSKCIDRYGLFDLSSYFTLRITFWPWPSRFSPISASRPPSFAGEHVPYDRTPHQP